MDREELFRRLIGLFSPAIYINPNAAIFSIANQNNEKIANIVAMIKESEDKIFTILGQYDSQTDDEGRQNVVNNVSMNVVIDPAMILIANPNGAKIF